MTCAEVAGKIALFCLAYCTGVVGVVLLGSFVADFLDRWWPGTGERYRDWVFEQFMELLS